MTAVQTHLESLKQKIGSVIVVFEIGVQRLATKRNKICLLIKEQSCIGFACFLSAGHFDADFSCRNSISLDAMLSAWICLLTFIVLEGKSISSLGCPEIYSHGTDGITGSRHYGHYGLDKFLGIT